MFPIPDMLLKPLAHARAQELLVRYHGARTRAFRDRHVSTEVRSTAFSSSSLLTSTQRQPIGYMISDQSSNHDLVFAGERTVSSATVPGQGIRADFRTRCGQNPGVTGGYSLYMGFLSLAGGQRPMCDYMVARPKCNWVLEKSLQDLSHERKNFPVIPRALH
jgi:hypothetical protein